MMRSEPWRLAALLLLAVLAAPAVLLAQDAGKPAGDPDAGGEQAPVDAGMAGPSDEPSRADELRQTAVRISDLIGGELDVSMEPAALFRADLDLTDEAQVEVEARRLTMLLATAIRDGGADAGAGGGSDALPDAGLTAAADLWRAQLELDEARRQFLVLPAAERRRLLEQHGERQRQAADESAGATDADRRAQQAAEERRKALEELKRARTASLRMLEEERARLLGVKERQAHYEATLLRADKELANRAEEAVAFGVKVTDLVEKLVGREAGADQADLLYDQLASRLRRAREELSSALAALPSATSEVPGPGASRLTELDPETDRAAVDELFGELVAEERRLQQSAVDLAWKRADGLHRRMESLRKGRVALLPWISSARRSTLEGLGSAGVAQATEEVKQALVRIRYHSRSTVHWVRGVTSAERDRSVHVGIGLTALKALATLVLFLWWRRYAGRRIDELRQRAREARRRKAARADSWDGALSFVLRIRRPVEWLALLAIVLWLVGPTLSGRMEVRLLWIVVGWLLGTRLVVGALDELLARQKFLSRKETETSKLRLRTLRLLGRLTVLFGVLLSLTSELVGPGTIHRWLTWICWLVALPVALLILRWWRPTVFKRLETRQHHSRVAQWVLARRQGWSRILATLVGSLFVFALALGRVVQAAFSRFDATRRLLAYWFRREVTRQADEAKLELEPLGEEHRAGFDPRRPSAELVEALSAKTRKRLDDAVSEPRGQVIAVVGERGAGKSTVLAHLAAGGSGVLALRCPPGGLAELRRALAVELGLGEDAAEEAIRQHLEQRSAPVVLLDDAHRLVRPQIGGLDDLDAALELLGARAGKPGTWIVGIDAVTWRYVQRARGGRPVFDEVVTLGPWPEELIAKLLRNRSREVGIAPSFEQLLTEDPLDELEKADLLERAETNYYRLLWDYAAGNPAVALWYWRESLWLVGEDRCLVQLFQAPETADLEALPDAALFLLRAVVQGDGASFDDMVGSTTLPEDRVREALRYSRLRGYVNQIGSRYWVTWPWFRAITRVLQRRHLLAGGAS